MPKVLRDNKPTKQTKNTVSLFHLGHQLPGLEPAFKCGLYTQ